MTALVSTSPPRYLIYGVHRMHWLAPTLALAVLLGIPLYRKPQDDPSPHPFQIQLSSQCTVCMESPETIPAHALAIASGQLQHVVHQDPQSTQTQFQPASQSHQPHTDYTGNEHTQDHSFRFRRSRCSAEFLEINTESQAKLGDREI